jgi:ATP-binding cassette subfamily F protein uup
VFILQSDPMAAPILAYEDLGLVQGSGWLFRNLALFVAPRDRLALIGRNGAGKTTLLKLLAGQIDADEGRRTVVPGSRIVLLEQEPALTGFSTLRDFAMSGGGAAHDVDAIADQIGIDLDREALTASRARWQWRPTFCYSTSRPTISTFQRSSGWRAG